MTVMPDASVWEGEAVTLQCEAQINKQGTQLQYRYIKDNGDLSGARSRDPYSIPAAEPRDTGIYQCEVEAAGTGLKKRSGSVSLTVRELFRKPILTFTPVSPVWEGEAVTLQCGVQIDKWGTRLQYRYIKDNGDLRGAGSQDQHSIPAAELRDTGSYQCEVEAAGTGLKKRSDSVRLSLKELPQTTLTLEPPFPEICTGETVTLRCGVEGGSAGWKYLWYKDSEDTPVLQTAGCSITCDSYTITAAAVSDQGQYCCRGQRGDQPLYSHLSEKVILTVSDVHPKAVLTLQPAWAQIFTGETVTLRCEVEGCSAGWRFKQYRDGREKAGCSKQYSRRDGHSCTISNAQNSHSGVYWCESGQERSNAVNLTVSKLPQPTITLEPPFLEICTGETVTLRCGVEVGSAGWKYLWYKDSEDTPVLQTAGRSITGDSYTITAAAVSDQGQYCCRGQRGDQPLYSQLSDKVILTVSEVRPKAVLTLHPAWTQIFTGETVTLSCEVEGGSAGWRFKQYRDGHEEVWCNDQYNRRDGDSCTISTAQYNHSGVYWCESGQERSNAVNLTMSNTWVILQTPPQPVIEGDSLTLRCRVRTNYTFSRIVFFKDNEEIQSPNNTELSVDRVSKSDEGSYKCSAMWNSSTYSGDSAEVRVSVRELFSWVTLTASPGATVKEGEALNLTCEAAVNKTPRPQLHYTIVRDGEPVTNSTDSALYSIASTEKSHTGSYTCAVESQGVKKSSQELHIEVQTSWHSAVAIGYRVSFTLIHFIVFTLLLLQYCRIQGSLCIAGGTSRKTSDQDQEQSAERIELCSRVQHTGVELQ
ncbi:Fc receptor-like protein 3 [Acipenser ruthenus]|uniref:Fc receptor-like protein 3 n=1 Tax=Acipenser ruthenus TaxID=7906 RepID=UPI0027418582|nr:Fc receptor-like protein 3 [Acipenser ruthenus]